MSARVLTPRLLPAREAWKQVEADAGRLARGSGEIVVGPWLSELGFEVLYWIPFVRFLQRRLEIAPERLVVVSRGGVGSWYEGIGGAYRDLLDGFGEDEFRKHTEDRWTAAGGQKQMQYGAFDREALRRLGIDAGARGADVLHPSFMYRLFRDFWRGREPIASVLERVVYERFAAPDWPQLAARLPAGDFFAVKFYGRPSFPDNAENRAVVQRVVRRLAERAPVVSLETGLRLDDHSEFAASGGGARHEIVCPLDDVPAARNLEAQTVVLSRATAFFGTYGGFSYLAPSLGVPSFAYYSAPEHFLKSHLAVARRAAARLDAPLSLVDARSAGALSIAGL